MKTVGIIGGLGPQTTAEFYTEVVFCCQGKNSEARPPILVWSVPLRFEIERELLCNAKGEQSYLPFLIDAAQRLERAGADFIVMPCNTLHVFIGEIRASVKVPVLSIIEETVKFLGNENVQEVGILATESSIKKKIYQNGFAQAGITHMLPNGLQQAKIGRVISNLVQGRQANKDREDVLGVISSFEKKGVKSAILACTDLQLLIPQRPRMRIWDTVKILADATVREILEGD